MNAIVRYISEKEVAKITGRSLSALRSDRYKGQGIPYTKFGRLVRYSDSDVIKFMEARKIETDN